MVIEKPKENEHASNKSKASQIKTEDLDVKKQTKVRPVAHPSSLLTHLKSFFKTPINCIAVGVATIALIVGVGAFVSIKNSQYTADTSTSSSVSQPTSKTLLQDAYEKAVSAVGMSPSQTKIEHTDGGMIQISDNGKVITMRMPSETEAHTKDWLGMVAQILVKIAGVDKSSDALEKLQNISINHILDYQEVKDTNDYISEFVGQIELTDKVSAVIGVAANDNYPFMYFAFYENDADLISVTSDVCTGFYTRNMFTTAMQLQMKDASDRYYTTDIIEKLFSIKKDRFVLSSEDKTLTLISGGLNQDSMLRGESIVDNLTSCTLATMGIPSDVLKAMTADRKNGWKSGTYYWDDYQVEINYSKEDKSYTPYYIFSKKNDSTNSQQEKASVTPVERDGVTTAQIMRDGMMSTQIIIPVSCAWNTNDYTVNSSGYLRKSDGSSTRTDTTMLSDNKYAKYGAVTCEAETVKVKYDLPEGYTYHPNLGGAYRASNDEEKHELSIHVKMSIFADQKEGFYSSSDIDGYQFNVYDSNNKKVESYFIKLTPKFDSDQYNFLRNWEVRID